MNKTMKIASIAGAITFIILLTTWAIAPENEYQGENIPDISYTCYSGGVIIISGTGTVVMGGTQNSGYLVVTDSITKKPRLLRADCMVDHL